MSNGHHRGRSSRQNQQKVDWYNLFAVFKQGPTWQEYFRLRKKIAEVIPSRDRRRFQLWDQLDQMALPLITAPEQVIAVCKAFKLEVGNRPLHRGWRGWQRDFGLELIKYAWNLPDRPGFKLGFEVLKQEDGSSESLGEAADLLEEGNVPPKMSDNDTLALLLWVQAKYFREAEAIKLAKQLRQALPDGNESEIEALWQELALLLGPPERRLDKKETQEAPQVAPAPQEETPQVAPEPQQTASQATPSVSEQPPSPVPPASPSPKASPAVSQAAQEVLMAWQEAVGAFTGLVQEQAAGVAQRDEFISLLQQQISNADQITQQAREQAETKVKRTLMQVLAEPLDHFQVAVALYEERDFTLIYESFTQALAQLGITPIGEMDRQFTVDQDDLVRSIDGQPVVGQNVQQIGLGWQLQLSNGTVHPLVYPRVRRLKR